MEASTRAERRRVRERDLVVAARRLFDERGMQDAPIEEIARAAGIARGIVYRHFSSKEELFVLTVTDYLDELASQLTTARESAGDDPREQLERITQAFVGFGQRYPAFLDSSIALMRRPARELNEIVSESVWLQLGQGMARCLDLLAETLRAGTEAGVFAVEDADYTANVLWTQALGVMHLGRLRVGVRQLAPGIPGLFTVGPERIVRTCVEHALAAVEPKAG